MIRINLLPSKKRATSRVRVPVGGGSGDALLVAIVIAWGALGGLGYWLLSNEQDETVRLRAEAAKVAAKVKEIRERIDEEGLQAKQDKVKQLKTAIEKLQAQKRTPIYVLHEMANILTPGKLPDFDAEVQRRRVVEDPEARLNEDWDGSSVWISKLHERGNGVLQIEGAARDAADLSEFVRRLRASARFGSVTHPEYNRVEKKRGKKQGGAAPPEQHVRFSMSVSVAAWD
ncbi:MAG: hypothetical protein B7733_21165 [Myxococcales bacterium FL481]|nr:MAG: hypothetical protein B7733_21165 [Myxococcales bacterium FL481]